MIVVFTDMQLPALCFLIYSRFSTWHFGIFKKLGVKGPRPLPLFGTLLPLMRKVDFFFGCVCVG